MRDLDLGDGTLVPASLLRAATPRDGGLAGQNENKSDMRVSIEVVADSISLPADGKKRMQPRRARAGNTAAVACVPTGGTRERFSSG